MRHILLALAALACVRPVWAQPLPFDDGKWKLQGERTSIETVDGRQAIAFENGAAVRRDLKLQDGTIDLDVQLTRRRSFVGLWFRAIDAENHEVITFDQAALYLPLRAGANELVVVVSDVFGGWGLQGRFRDMKRAEISRGPGRVNNCAVRGTMVTRSHVTGSMDWPDAGALPHPRSPRIGRHGRRLPRRRPAPAADRRAEDLAGERRS